MGAAETGVRSAEVDVYDPQGTQGLPYYTYDLTGANWTATFVVVDSDCFLSSYQLNTSVYQNSYTQACHKDTATQINFLNRELSSMFGCRSSSLTFNLPLLRYICHVQGRLEISPIASPLHLVVDQPNRPRTLD